MAVSLKFGPDVDMNPTDQPPVQRSCTRLYQDIARQLREAILAGEYKVGDKLPAERELAVRFDVSRPTVREAIIALEVDGLVDVRVGSGAYVCRAADEGDADVFDVSAFELTEARLLFEGEAAAVAATQIGDQELAALDALVERLGSTGGDVSGAEAADQEFHLLIARSTRNAAILHTVESLWTLRATSRACALLHAKARSADIRPIADEHTEILEALRARDAARARAAMRAHLGAVIEHLLFATEEQAVAQARRAVESERARYARTVIA